MLSAQDIFDRVYNHFIVNRQPRSTRMEKIGVGEYEACRYRGDGGAKCAAGLFIPDDQYAEEIEGALCLDIKERLEPGCAENIEMLRELQRAHDTNKTHLGMQTSMELVAYDFKLKVPNHETVISTTPACY